MSKILTVTIPSYNTEKYIDECLPYLIDERIISDIEILIVSDGSKDNTVSVAQKWADKYPDSIRVIDKENGGHGSTINRGILEATGKYFKVVDGDDWVVTENFVKLVDYLKQVEVDIINNPYLEHNEETTVETPMMNLEISARNIVEHDQVVEQIKIPPMHTITYRTSILKDNEIKIDEKMFYVDVEYICYPLPFVKTSVYLNFPVYVYRTNSGTQSMAISNMVKNRAMHLTMTKHIWNFITKLPKETSPTVKKVLTQRFSELIIAQYVINLSIPNRTERKSETSSFTTFLKDENVLNNNEILSLSKLLIRTNGSIIKPAVTMRNSLQSNRTWQVIERSILNSIKRMKK
ncbi:glycosyltransferase family A protein [Lactococcus sp. NH2-7C]|uniref:glycosyltransferase family 2 protein n=1 Tax=Lactococcus sp. NH2-7C TaxID=2879149 RepID=UPI001CDB7FA1|nr:glycosyltransferase family A protein [Lactococcus sp. NH2-7C]MCA2390889.1 glycosyltransferase family 2 protein [Lactococcus sp. NH2-7C]WGV29544.1 glycosyltransferase family A protein [Lactococcus sp. NH2-7C]